MPGPTSLLRLKLRARRARLAFLLAALLASPALNPVSAAAAAPVTRAWSGAYDCAQGPTGLRLLLTTEPDGSAHGLFDFHAVKQNPDVPQGCFELKGRIDAAGRFTLLPGAWRLQPPNYVSVALVGQEIAGGGLAGRVLGPGCTGFALQPLPRAAWGALQSACIGAVS
ncbi:hypothetical protein [Acidisoma sp. C75]